MADNSAITVGIWFVSLLTVLFIGLKLGGVIDGSWWWVLSPILISWSFACLILIIIGLVFLAAAVKGK